MITAIEIIGGLILLFLGGELLVRGAVSLAKDLGLSVFIIGLTIVAYGTSSPELFISTQAALDGHPDIALGNVIGSNISNILLVLGVSAFIYPVAVNKKTSSFDGAVMLGATALLAALSLFGVINIFGGIGLLSCLVLYSWIIFIKAKKAKNDIPQLQTEEVEEQLKLQLNRWQAIILCLISIVMLTYGGKFLIQGTVTVARHFGISEAVIGLTIIAFGGSTPELATSLMAAIHKKSDIVMGNIIGSNLFNILGIIGTTGVISDISVADKFITFDYPVVIVSTAILFVLMLKANKISRSVGAIFIASYVVYVACQFV